MWTKHVIKDYTRTKAMSAKLNNKRGQTDYTYAKEQDADEGTSLDY